MNYEELVKALRWCADESICRDDFSGEKCPYYDVRQDFCSMEDVMHDAAAAIEALEAEVEELKAKKMKLAENSLRFVGEVRELDKRRFEPKRGEWVEENRRPRSSQFVCSECHRTAYDPQPTRDKAWRKRCRYAYCPNCGAKMEVQDGE